MKLLKLLPIIGIIILIYIINKVGITSIYKTFLTANIFYVIIVIISLLFSVIFLTFKWYIILKAQNINIKFLYALKLYTIGLFYGTITPARSGSIIRASYLKDKTQKPFGECVSSIIIERLMDLFVIFVFATIGIIVFSKHLSSYLPIILIFFVLFGLASVLLLKSSVNKIFFTLAINFLIPGKLKERSQEVYDSFYSNILSVKKMIFPLFITFLVWIVLTVHIYLIAKAFNVTIPFIYMIFIFTISTLISIIPITVGGLGTREATLIFLFSFFSVPAAKAVSISFLAMVLSYLIVPVIGFVLSVREPPPEKLI